MTSCRSAQAAPTSGSFLKQYVSGSPRGREAFKKLCAETSSANSGLNERHRNLNKGRDRSAGAGLLNEPVIVQQLSEQVGFCHEMLKAICGIPQESRHLVTETYMRQVLEGVRQRQTAKKTGYPQINQQVQCKV